MPQHIILYDGDCGFCNKNVQLICRHDPHSTFYFASIQSETGQLLLRERNINDLQLDTFYLIAQDQVYRKSTAALKIIRKLEGLRWLAMLGSLLPRCLLDWVYDRVAVHRHNISTFANFSCEIPPKELKNRFLS